MSRVSYSLSAAEWSIDSSNDSNSEFVSLEVKMAMNLASNWCHITVYVPQATQPGLTDQAIGGAEGTIGQGGDGAAFGVKVRGNEITPGDAMTVELTAGEINEQVITAEVQSVWSTLERTLITGVTAMHKLSQTRLNQIYENQSLSQIVSDLANQTGVSTGQIDTGSTYSYLVVHESQNLLEHIRLLALRDGMDVYVDTDNKLTVNAFNKSSADHIFRYGMEILDLQISISNPVVNRVRVSGESPSSNQGTDTWPWLVKDISSFQSEAGDGGRLLVIQDGTVRTKDAADSLAAAKLGAIKDQSTRGQLKILGNPAVKLADAIEIRDAPKPELNGLFKVTEVRHVLNKRDGFLTYVAFSGQGGTASAGGLSSSASGGLGL